MKLSPINNQSESILLNNEEVYSILEFGINQLLVSVQLTDLLILDNWSVVQRISDPSSGNVQKCWQALLPGFNLESFPFVVVAGHETINLVNVKEHTLQPLIQAKNRNIRSQKAAFFMSSDSGFNMHFATHRSTEDRRREDCWYMMPLKDDFTQTLRTYK